MQTRKHNATGRTPASSTPATEAELKTLVHVEPVAMMRLAIAASKTAVTSGLYAIAAYVAYVMSVNVLRDPKHADFLTADKAWAELEKHIKKETGIGEQMCAIYLRNAKQVVIALKGNKYAAIKGAFGAEHDDAKAVAVIADWMEKMGATSVRTLSTLLGYSTGSAKKTNEPIETVLSGRVARSITSAIKAAGEEEVSPSVITRAAVSATPDKLATAREAIRLYVETDSADVDALTGLVQTINKAVDKLVAKQKAAKAKAKAKPDTVIKSKSGQVQSIAA